MPTVAVAGVDTVPLPSGRTIVPAMNPPSHALVERRRVRDHLTRALRAVRAAPVTHLSAAQRARRRAALRALSRYIDAGRFPVNRTRLPLTPVFVSPDGARCAMAALLESTGHHALVERVAREHNLARIAQLAHDPELTAWLDANGLTLAEAARIQPAYSPHTDAHWQPTVSVIASALGGTSTVEGPRVALAPGVRLGVRRFTHRMDGSGTVHYGAFSINAEYAARFVLGVGLAHHVGLVLQWDPDGYSQDAQWYLLAGPVAAITHDDATVAFGAQLGAGFSFRRRTVPLFFEGVAQGLGRAGDAAFRAGINVGVVW